MHKIKKHLNTVFLHIFLLSFCFVFALPMLSMFGTALKTEQAALTDIALFPSIKTFYWGNFLTVLNTTTFGNSIINSIIISLASTLMGILCSSCAGYALSRFKGRFFSFFVMLLVLLQMLPSMLVMVPTFLIYKNLGLTNTRLGLIICYSSASITFAIWLLKGFFDSISFEIEESAMIDGCTQFESFWRILLPISAPGIATAAIFTFVRAWNEYIMARILIQSDNLKTINLGLQKFVLENSINWALLSAGAVIATIPTILFLLFAQKHLVQGLTSGAIKG